MKELLKGLFRKMILLNLNDARDLLAENEQLQEKFVLACRILADFSDCPAADADAEFPECSGELDECGDNEHWECWQKYIGQKVEHEQVCRICGCTQNNACPGGCWWVEDDLCSACKEKIRRGKIDGR